MSQPQTYLNNADIAYPYETNGINAEHRALAESIDYGSRATPWNTPGLKVTRLRLLGGDGCPGWDVSYCHGILNGKAVDVALPFFFLGTNVVREIIAYAKADGVYAKGLGILDVISKLW